MSVDLALLERALHRVLADGDLAVDAGGWVDLDSALAAAAARVSAVAGAVRDDVVAVIGLRRPVRLELRGHALRPRVASRWSYPREFGAAAPCLVLFAARLDGGDRGVVPCAPTAESARASGGPSATVLRIDVPAAMAAGVRFLGIDDQTLVAIPAIPADAAVELPRDIAGLDEPAARAIADEVFRVEAGPRDDLVLTGPFETPDYWQYAAQSREYVATGDPGRMLVGGAGIAVAKVDGSVLRPTFHQPAQFAG